MSPAVDVDVAVVGAGVAGLTAAHELRRAGLTVRVFEELPYVGGRMHSFRHEGYVIDEGAEQIPEQGYRATWELLARLGVTDRDVPRIGKAVGVWRAGRAHPGVAEPAALVSGAGLSPRARLDLARLLAWTAVHRTEFDSDRPERTPAGTRTVASFARRYHPDLHDYLLQPVAGCFFGWDTARSAVAPLISLMQAVGPASRWRTYHDGMDLLARRLAEHADVETGAPVHEVVDDGREVRLHGPAGTVTARAAVLAVPAPVAARLHPAAPEDEREFLTACTFTPSFKVSCLLDRPLAPASARPLYALLTPDAEDGLLSGILVDHAKHPGRAPAGKGLLTLMADPRRIPELCGADPRETAARLIRAAARYVPGLPGAVREHFVHGFTHALPEATPEALAHRPRFAARAPRRVEYAGDWLTLCPASEAAVRSGALAASRVLSRLHPSPTAAAARPAAPAPRSDRLETA
ncbi:protoporphyrinogen/coproporphyrinogen oxidase [Streptomyces cavernicola]|uniref:NAD(P)/FAD-dependent oxidoreductase n=1 Tax=Streptomyces cavernicola TaxID=3043613 RepID=A0ABT6SC05_9ACTN|nr:NAD(P)/FAD-dependent oxidoreductase [Streptomyces sp. B-S-A6]MDI3405726.1 NAD(P)/FAD-dependent oxidoreductase [Streptomyces sp. B-S-A6]